MAKISGFFTPLRYPGGKGKLANYVKQIISQNNLVGGGYVEPYAGGAAVALELLLLGYVDEIHINDINFGIYSFWDAVVNNAEEFMHKIESTPITVDEWYKQKDIQLNWSEKSLDLAFSTFFLNRCNRSGILKGGVIGGKSQNGKWKIDARFNKNELIHRIRRISKFKDQIFLYNDDAVSLVEKLAVCMPSKTLFYLDPPYYVKGEGLYDNFYDHYDHELIARTIQSGSVKNWIVSYDDVPQIKSMYENMNFLRYRLNYSAQQRGHGGEIMFFSKNLNIPDIPKDGPVHAVI